jgi:hypothetical protein
MVLMAFLMNTSGIFQKDLLWIQYIYSVTPSAWSLPGTLERGKNHNSAETRQRPENFPKFTSYPPIVHYEETISEADFKNNPKTR